MSTIPTTPERDSLATDGALSPRLSVAALISLGSGVLLLITHMMVRIVMVIPALTWDSSLDVSFGVALLGIASIVPIVAGIVLGHFAYVASAAGKPRRGRPLAVAALTLNYVLFLLYLNRIIVVIIVALTQSYDGISLEIFAYYI
jgi:hypothetical protein